jgi:hypothetical protein
MLLTDLVFAILGTPILAASAGAGAGCGGPEAVTEATPAGIRAHFRARHVTILTFLGYSAAGYEDLQAVLDEAGRILDAVDPASTIVNIGATPDGIGAVYELAKRRGFRTTGIVSTQARSDGVALSPCVDEVFYVVDATWGGFLPGTGQLSPTSQAMVESSDRIVAFGGGAVTRDELVAARRLVKDVRFIPADMNHAVAIERARAHGEPPPASFAGAASEVFGPTER